MVPGEGSVVGSGRALLPCSSRARDVRPLGWALLRRDLLSAGVKLMSEG